MRSSTSDAVEAPTGSKGRVGTDRSCFLPCFFFIKRIWRRARGREAGRLLQARPLLLVPHQAVEDGQNLLAIVVNTLQRFPERLLEVPRFQPFIEQYRGHVDVLAQRFDGVATQK